MMVSRWAYCSGVMYAALRLTLCLNRANQETVLPPGTGTGAGGGGGGSLISMPNLPSLDFYLENEIKKAAAMLYCFTATLGEVARLYLNCCSFRLWDHV